MLPLKSQNSGRLSLLPLYWVKVRWKPFQSMRRYPRPGRCRVAPIVSCGSSPRPLMRPAVEEAFDGEGGGAEWDRVGTEVSQLDQGPGEGMPERMRGGRCADGGGRGERGASDRRADAPPAPTG